jgi:hypothetical protein
MPSGFTDELLQFSALHRLGCSLGYKYRHTPFRSPHTDAPWTADDSLIRRAADWRWRGLGRGFGRVPGAYSFLGFNRHFQDSGATITEPVAEWVRIPLSDKILADENVSDFSGLQAYVRDAAERSGGMVQFRLTAGRRFFGWILDAHPDPPDGLDLTSTYRALRGRDPWKSAFPPDPLKILVHIRQGDTAVLDTPWGSYIPLWPNVADAPREFGSFETIPAKRLLRVEDFRRFQLRLERKLSWPAFSVVCSDGFQRGFEILAGHRERSGMTDARWSALMRSRSGYDRRQFASFRDGARRRLVVGETRRALCTLIHSALEADVVILGGHQRLLPKLFATYESPEEMPLVLVLHRGGHFGRDVKRYYDFCGLGRRLESFLPVDLRNPDFPRILDAIGKRRR